MNLKKTVLSSLAVVALSISMAAPVAFAEESEPVTSTVREGGDFTFGFSGNPITFPAVTVSTNDGAQSTRIMREIEFNDSHAYNEQGYSLQIEADPLVSGGYTISNENLTVRKRSGSNFCPANNAAQPEVGGNEFQDVTVHLVHPGSTSALGVPMTDSLPLVSATDGRGCGEASFGVTYDLYVPAGTYTAGGEAIYESEITITNMIGVQ